MSLQSVPSVLDYLTVVLTVQQLLLACLPSSPLLLPNISPSVPGPPPSCSCCGISEVQIGSFIHKTHFVLLGLGCEVLFSISPIPHPSPLPSPVCPLLHRQPVSAFIIYTSGLLWWLSVKESACNAGDMGLIPGSGRSLGEGNGNPLQYSCWEIPWTE